MEEYCVAQYPERVEQMARELNPSLPDSPEARDAFMTNLLQRLLQM